MADQSEWERAYLSYETPDQELGKFQRRLRMLGAENWSKESRVLELFSGRGSGLHAWHALGYRDLTGLDWSENLVRSYRGPGRMVTGDARALSFDELSFDVVSVHGGLHHLETPEDLAATVAGIRKVLRPDGRFLLVEPWQTPFLSLAHAVGRVQIIRRLARKIDAFATMVELEGPIYERWLANPEEILGVLRANFISDRKWVRFGKIYFLGRPLS